MTTLSWFLYLTNISEGLNKFFGAFFILSLLFCLVTACIVAFDDHFEGWKPWPWWKTVLLLGLGVPTLLTSLVPDYNTILTIAAVEMGNDVLYSEEFQRLLDTYLPKED